MVADSPEIGAYLAFEPRRLRELLFEGRREAGHLLLERLAVVLDCLGADVAARGKDVVVGGDLLQRGALAEAGHVLVFSGPRLAPPGVVGMRDPLDIFFREVAVGTVRHVAYLAGVYKERLAAAVAEASVALVASEEPEADWDLGGVEELRRHGDDAINEVGLDEGLPDDAFPARVGRERTIGEHEARDTLRGEMVDHVLHPGEVGVADRRRAELPARVVAQALAAPVRDVERGVGEDEICFQVFVQVIVEGVGVLGAEIPVYT